MNLKKLIFSLSLLLSINSTAFALTIEEYNKLKTTSISYTEAYIGGVGEGYIWSNVLLEAQEKQPFFCPPPKIALNSGNFISIMETQIGLRKKSGLPQTQVELLLYRGLVETFPCKK